MPSLDIASAYIDGRLLAAVVRGKTIIALYADAFDRACAFGAVYGAKIIKVDMRLSAAICDLGDDGAQGILPLKKNHTCQAGDVLAVRIRSEGRSGAADENDKLPRLTRLADIPEKTGLIAPGPNAVERARADYGAERIVRERGPSIEAFETCDAFSLLSALEHPRVDLPSGGSLIIESTAALTAIDVNQGRGSLSAVQTEAVTEVARHLRLRNLGGLILVDFIRAKTPADRTSLRARTEAALAEDPAKPQLHGFTRTGLAEITRPRRDASLQEKLLK